MFTLGDERGHHVIPPNCMFAQRRGACFHPHHSRGQTEYWRYSSRRKEWIYLFHSWLQLQDICIPSHWTSLFPWGLTLHSAFYRHRAISSRCPGSSSWTFTFWTFSRFLPTSFECFPLPYFLSDLWKDPKANQRKLQQNVYNSVHSKNLEISTWVYNLLALKGYAGKWMECTDFLTKCVRGSHTTLQVNCQVTERCPILFCVVIWAAC